MNNLGLINVFAKDIALLDDWEQAVWAGFNVSPDGKLSEELHASQVKAMPAATQAPEEFLPKGLARLQEVAESKLGISMIRPHDDVPKLVARTHRFRATDKHGLFELAKDVARLTGRQHRYITAAHHRRSTERRELGFIEIPGEGACDKN